MNNYPALTPKDLPAPPKWWKAVGVGIIVTGMAMGTGELVMWPNLVIQYGLAILWFALVGITLQYFINQEIARATMATGESFFTSSGRLIRWSPLFWLGSVILLYIWDYWMKLEPFYWKDKASFTIVVLLFVNSLFFYQLIIL